MNFISSVKAKMAQLLSSRDSRREDIFKKFKKEEEIAMEAIRDVELAIFTLFHDDTIPLKDQDYKMLMNNTMTLYKYVRSDEDRMNRVLRISRSNSSNSSRQARRLNRLNRRSLD